MTMLLDIIRYLVPDAECHYTGEPETVEEYNAQFVWLDDRPQPSWADIETAAPIVENLKAVVAVQQLRHAAYVAEADPLFFKWQRGESTQQEWLDKVEEIRGAFPNEV